MDLLDLMSEEDWVALETEIHESFGGNVATSRPDGSKLTGYVAWANKVCPLIKGNKQSLSAICAVAAQSSMAKAREAGEPVIIHCDAGFCRICMPIKLNGDFFGVLGVCGLLLDEDVENFYVSKVTERPEEEIAELAGSAIRITKQESLNLAGFMKTKIDGIVSNVKV